MVLAALVLAAGHSVAPGVELRPGVDLRWNAPAECPDAATVTRRLSEYLEQAPASGPPARVDADVERRLDGTWALTLHFDGGLGEPRVLTNASCEGLAEAAVVVVAITVAPSVAPSVAPPEDPVAPAPEPRPVAPARRSAGAADAARPTRSVRVSVAALAGVGLGPVPIGAALVPAFALTVGRWRLGVAAVYHPRRSLRLTDLPQSGTNLSHWAIGPDVSWLAPARPWLAVPVGAALEFGQLVANPVNLDNGRPRRSFWAAGLVTVGLRFRVHARVGLWVAPTMVIPLTPSRVLVGGESSPLFRSTPVGFRGLGGVEVMLW